MTKFSLHAGAGLVMIALTSILGCSSDSDHRSSDSSTYRESEKSTAAREGATVDITSSHTFYPREVTIRAGESVTWRNASSDVHTVTADPSKATNRDDVVLPAGAKPFHSGEIRPGKTWRQTFAAAGTYRYVCTMHEREGMSGTVIVRPMEPQTK